jgi:phenylalanyl-tRNA synthetase alpha chain
MSEAVKYEDLRIEADRIFGAFEQEFKRFERFAVDRQDPKSMAELLKQLHTEGYALADAKTAIRELNDLRTKYTAKKSEWANAKKQIGRVADSQERAWAGQHLLFRDVKINELLEYARLTLDQVAESLQTERESIDVTMPGRRPRPGHLHPVTLMRERIEDIFVSLGYAVEDDREIETDFYNFDALNIPEGHPARDPQDTFYTALLCDRKPRRCRFTRCKGAARRCA